jgi:hypothetical protein
MARQLSKDECAKILEKITSLQKIQYADLLREDLPDKWNFKSLGPYIDYSQLIINECAKIDFCLMPYDGLDQLLPTMQSLLNNFTQMKSFQMESENPGHARNNIINSFNDCYCKLLQAVGNILPLYLLTTKHLSAIHEMHKDIRDVYIEQQKNIDAERNTVIKSINEEMSKLQKKLNDLSDQTETELAILRDKAIIDINQVKTTATQVEKYSKIQDFWKAQADNGRFLSLVFLGLITVTIVVAFMVFKNSMYPFIECGDISNTRLGIYGLYVVLCIWALRLLIKIMMTNVNIYYTANEKRTLIDTFIAMNLIRSNISDTEMGIILGAIFKPMPHGLIKDDHMPNTPATLLAKIIDKNR